MTVQDEIREEMRDGLYGLMAEFETPDALIHAAHKVHAAGYKNVDAFTPFPIEEVTEALGLHKSKLPILVLLGGIMGALGGFGLEYWTSVIEYPMNIGGRPFFSWQSFIVPMYECTILAAASTAVFGMFILNKLPQPYHPVFNVPSFARASNDRYFLVIEAADPKFDERGTRTFLSNLNPHEVSDVAL